MPKIYKILFLVVIAVTAKNIAFAQVTDSVQIPVKNDSIPLTVKNDTVPTSVNVALENIFNAKSPQEYIISDIKVTGTKSFDPNLIISISGLAVGDKVMIPGGDNFSKAITNLWKQNLVSDVQVYFTNLIGNKLSVEINITDRPTLANFKFKGIGKSEADDITTKLGLTKGRVTRVTENLKNTSVNIIKKFYVDKGFRNVD
ncbi:MAG: BamA/OMP85 family outer membrane protein, partial [Ginsengibacter sp.]